MPRDESKPVESRRDWEDVQTNQSDKTERLRVKGGWLYRTVVGASAVSLVFVAEP
jgi:hypothetical protein